MAISSGLELEIASSPVAVEGRLFGTVAAEVVEVLRTIVRRSRNPIIIPGG